MLDARARAVLSGTRFSDLRWHSETDSTNREALDLARAGAAEGVVVVADHQTAGRGRLDRTWEAPPGSSLLTSVLLRPSLPPDQVARVAMVLAISASDALEEVAGFRPQLKWPNDLVVARGGRGTRKLGGILSEAILSGARVDAVVVGLGLNLNWPHPLPEHLAEVAVSADEVAGRPVDRTAVLLCLLGRLEEHYGLLFEGGGGRAALVNYRRQCCTLGRRVRVELAGEVVVGRAVDISDEGHLVVAPEEEGASPRRITTADVVHLREDAAWTSS
ncbi:MAG: biotin--[acetyl-CoA-carboxylase] ligase [Acidimicrobiales bacterium]